ncbi:hypothetical protein E2C01_085123 [Portunus trituberculatus]|uniref:Uncharacterized protein n=1 Tax=Portunus trituberculatus TaxID=210409 RepID=A0A5B7J5X5_PORTR|nr:hypothetical protein [Portunus trituberculatus]
MPLTCRRLIAPPVTWAGWGGAGRGRARLGGMEWDGRVSFRNISMPFLLYIQKGVRVPRLTSSQVSAGVLKLSLVFFLLFEINRGL